MQHGAKRIKIYTNINHHNCTEVEMQTTNRFVILATDAHNAKTTEENKVEKTAKPAPVL